MTKFTLCFSITLFSYTFNTYTVELNSNILSITRKLRIIYISHPHADHHLGLVRILAERKRLLNGFGDSVLVIAPPSVLAFLRDYSLVDTSIAGSYYPMSCRLIDESDTCIRPDEFWIDDRSINAKQNYSEQLVCVDICPQTNFRTISSSIEAMTIISGIFEDMNINAIVNVPVYHCAQSYGVSVLWKNGLKLVYSGDTRPCKRLVGLGLGATILIHE
jgi:ribonuclease Z